jgi:hypothetical protein
LETSGKAGAFGNRGDKEISDSNDSGYNHNSVPFDDNRLLFAPL